MANDNLHDESFLKATPRAPSVLTLWILAAIIAAPLSLAGGFIVTGRPEDGAYALPFVAILAFKVLRTVLDG